MQRFVSGIGHHESQRLYERVYVVETSCAWQSDSMQCLTITETLLLKFIQNFFTYAEGYEVRVSLCILLN